MAQQNPYYKSDLDIMIDLKYDGVSVSSGVDFEIISYDSFNHGKVFKYIPSSDVIHYESGVWVIRFAADKQKIVGTYTVRCIVDLSAHNLGQQQVVFKNAFVLENPTIPDLDYQSSQVRLEGTVESTIMALTGTLDVQLLIKNVTYDASTMQIYVTFRNGTTITIDGHNIFPFRVMSEEDYEDIPPLQVMKNVFYYTYEGGEPTEVDITPTGEAPFEYRLLLPESWAYVDDLPSGDNKLCMILGRTESVGGNEYKLKLS